jgi:hypothetical protein
MSSSNGNGNGRLLRMPPDRTGALKYTFDEMAEAIVEAKGADRNSSRQDRMFA